MTDSAPFTRKVESNVELALTNIPAVLDVGVNAFVKRGSQAPDEPDTVHAAPVTDRSPAELACTQDVAAEERLSKVMAPVAVRAPFKRVVPTMPKVVVGDAVPIPTRFSLALTTRVLASRLRPVFRVVVAVGESGIWKIAVPPSVRTLKILPVRFPALTTSFTTSPVVRAEVEAVSQLAVVTEEVAVI